MQKEFVNNPMAKAELGGDYLLVGRIQKPHGVKGELEIVSYCRPPKSLFQYPNWRDNTGCPLILSLAKHLTITPTTAPNNLELLSIRQKTKKSGLVFLVTIKHCDNRNQAAAICPLDIYIARADLPPLPPGEFYLHDIIGYKVYDEQHQPLGRVKGFSNYGAGDILVITNNQAEWLLPVSRSAITTINHNNQSLVVVSALLC